jgi:type IV secretion system protein VirD4
VAVDQFAELHRRLQAVGPRLYVGQGANGSAWAPPGHCVLILGPPRSGKTTGAVIPNVLAAPGAVVSTSTKPDVVRATLAHRATLGTCWLFDPTGSVSTPEGAVRLRWSPVSAAQEWDEAMVSARVMVGAARPGGNYGESMHWSERAEALLACLLHAAARSGGEMATVVQWVLTHDLGAARATLQGHGARLPATVLAGLAVTDRRELSAIWSTASGVLAAYRSEAVLNEASRPNFDPSSFPGGADTVYVCAPARYQALTAPIVVAFMEQIRAATYQASSLGRLSNPVTLMLDEVANIAPLPDLPSMVSEGGGQGLLTLACLQDLSQARHRWGDQAAGFLSLFGTKLVLPGVADLATLQLVSKLGGEIDIPHRSTSQGPWWAASHGARSVTWTTQRQPRLPVDAIRELPPNTAVVLSGADRPATVALPPWWEAPVLDRSAHAGRGPLRPPATPLDVAQGLSTIPSAGPQGLRRRTGPPTHPELGGSAPPSD